MSVKKFRAGLAAAAVLTALLCGCGRGGEPDRSAQGEKTDDAGANHRIDVVEMESTAESAALQESVPNDGIKDELPPIENLYAFMPREYTFSSGAGGWATGITLLEDGSFEGIFHDSNMGETGPGYPNGSVLLCEFKGKFAQPEYVDGYIYRTHVETLEWDRKREDEIIDGVMYDYGEPYGLCDDAQILIYLPGTPIRDIDGEFMSWSFIRSKNRERLPEGLFGIYNVTEGYGFVGISPDNPWDQWYVGENEKAQVKLYRSYYCSYFSVHGKEKSAGESGNGHNISTDFDWDDDDQTDFVCKMINFDTTPRTYEEKYKLHLEFDKERSKCSVTFTSIEGEDMTAYGGTKDGILTIKLEPEKLPEQ